MKLLQVAKKFPPPFGGIETVLEELVRGLHALEPNLKLDVLATHPKPESSVVAFPGGPMIRRVWAPLEIARTPIAPTYPFALANADADLLHFHFPYPWSELSHLLLGRETPYLVSYHSDIVKQKQLLKVYSPFMRRFLHGATRVVVASPHMLHSSETIRALPASKVRVIPYGISTARFAGTPATLEFAAEWRKRLSKGRPLLLFVGRLVYYKGLEVLLRALQFLDADLIVVGEGPERPKLTEQATQLGVANRIQWLGSVSVAELTSLYHAVDLFVLPSTDPSEAFGMVQIEAHASGLPVVSSNLDTGVTFINVDGKTGYTFPVGDHIGLSQRIRDLLASPGQRREFGAFAQRRAVAEFDTAIMARKYLDLYFEVLGEHQARLPA